MTAGRIELPEKLIPVFSGEALYRGAYGGSAPTYRGTLTGGGTLAVLAYCNGTSWEAH